MKHYMLYLQEVALCGGEEIRDYLFSDLISVEERLLRWGIIA